MIRALALSLVLSSPAAAMTGQTVTGLVEKALAAAGVFAQPLIAAERRFPDCRAPLRITAAPEGWSTALLTCPDPPWQRRIRTGAFPNPQAPSRAPQPAATGRHVVMARSLARGAVIAAGDLALADDADATPPDHFADSAALVGRRMKQALGTGQTLLSRHLDLQWAVTAKSPVAIVALGPAVEIAMPGVALDNGQLGDLVRVQNSGSGRIVTGRVISADRVAVSPNMN